MILKKNKKTQLMSESVLAIVSIVVVGITLFFISTMIGSVNTKYNEITPQLNYEFPGTFVYSFLFVNLKEEDKLKFSNYQDINYVKDLIWINTAESKLLVENYKKEYIDSLKSASTPINNLNSNLFTLYSSFSKNEIDENNLLVIDTGISKDNLADFNNLVYSNNFIMPIKTKDGDFSTVRFLG